MENYKPLWKAIRYPGNRQIFCVWFDGPIELLPDSLRQKNADKPKWYLRVSRIETVAKDAIFWANSFNQDGV